MDAEGREYKTTDYILLLDSAKKNLKTTLLHSGDNFPSVSVDYETSMNNENRIIGNMKYSIPVGKNSL